MIPVDQRVDGPLGDCFSACLASVLELPAEAVPRFMAELPWDPSTQGTRLAWIEAFFASVNGFLAPRGLAYFEATSAGPLPDCLWAAVPPGYWVAGGVTLGGNGHCVVMRGRAMIHDPFPGGGGLAVVTTIGLLVPVDPARWK